MPTAPVYILAGKVSDLSAYADENARRMDTGRAMIAIGDTEWTFADTAEGEHVKRAHYVDLIEGLRDFSGRNLIWSQANDVPAEPAPEPERRTYQVTLYAKRFLHRTVKIYDCASRREAIERAAAMPDADLTDGDWTTRDEIHPEPFDTADAEIIENNA